jgi:hypothetical protein
MKLRVRRPGGFESLRARMPGLLAGPPEIVHADLPVDGWSLMAELQPSRE